MREGTAEADVFRNVHVLLGVAQMYRSPFNIVHAKVSVSWRSYTYTTTGQLGTSGYGACRRTPYITGENGKGPTEPR